MIGERFNLVRSFLIASAAILGLGMTGIGIWVSSRIEEAASENAAAVAALYVDGIVAPLVQSLRTEKTLDAEARRLIDERLNRGLMSRDLHAFKIWLPDGLVVYASNPDLVGRRFDVAAGLKAAAQGRVHTEFNELADDENATERSSNVALLEVYSPLRDSETGDVIAIVEFYDAASSLEEELIQSRLESWAIVGVATAAMLALLSGIILRGGRLIETQRRRLGEQIDQLSSLLGQNETLRHRVDQAHRRGAALNERYLRRISAEIHDGPVQHLAFASLRLKPSGKDLSNSDRVAVSDALDEAMGELRLISRGLTLPDLNGLSPQDVVRRAVQAHQRRVEAEVLLELADPLPNLSHAENIGLFRFIQEGLNNATRHAGGHRSRIVLSREGDEIVARIADEGPGFDPAAPTSGLGLSGLRERFIGLGGMFQVESSPDGTVLTATLPVSKRP